MDHILQRVRDKWGEEYVLATNDGIQIEDSTSIGEFSKIAICAVTVDIIFQLPFLLPHTNLFKHGRLPVRCKINILFYVTFAPAYLSHCNIIYHCCGYQLVMLNRAADKKSKLERCKGSLRSLSKWAVVKQLVPYSGYFSRGAYFTDFAQRALISLKVSEMWSIRVQLAATVL